MAAKLTPFRIHQFVFKICEVEPATARRDAKTEAWPGIVYYGADAARVIWIDNTDDYYDGERGPQYSRESLDADLAAAQLVVDAIRTPQVIKSPDDKEVSKALQHVYDAVHARTEPPKDWLEWFSARLGEIVTLPQLNSRGKPKKLHRGVGKQKSQKCACTRTQFAATLLAGLKFKDVTMLWHDHTKKFH